MANIVERAHLAKHRSQFDLIVAYEQLRIAREQEHLSGFTTPYGAFASHVGSMGDATLPGTFQMNMNIMAGEKLGVEIHPYLDNFVIATNGTLQEHMLTLVWLIERLREGEWYVGDYDLDSEQMEVLGFSVGKDGKLPGMRTLNPILNAPQPTTIAEVDRMLGAYNFCAQHGRANPVTRTFLSDATKMRKPKRGKTDHRKFPPYTLNGKFVWTDACKESWEQLKADMESCLRLM